MSIITHIQIYNYTTELTKQWPSDDVPGGDIGCGRVVDAHQVVARGPKPLHKYWHGVALCHHVGQVHCVVNPDSTARAVPVIDVWRGPTLRWAHTPVTGTCTCNTALNLDCCGGAAVDAVESGAVQRCDQRGPAIEGADSLDHVIGVMDPVGRGELTDERGGARWACTSYKRSS